MSALAPYDGVLLVSFGGPEGPDEVLPFMENVTRGRGIPPERLREVAQHYYARAGVSPINGENRALIAALEAELSRRAESLPVLWGNRNAPPFLTDALTQAHERGLRRLVAVFTSAYSSYSSCRQYRENLADAVAELGPVGADLRIDKVAPYAGEPAFIEPMVRLTTRALEEALAAHVDSGQGPRASSVRLVFVTHSIPDTMNAASGPPQVEGAYRSQHLAVAEAVAAQSVAPFGVEVGWELTYCSRSGPPSQPWLEPDINDALERLAGEGVRTVVVVPIGFVADHMEVVYDLDEQAQDTAARFGLKLIRVSTVRAAPDFVAGLVDLLQARAALARGETAERTALPSTCPARCCANPRGDRPALCGADSGAVTV